ncbi:fibroblast growth factor 22 [Ranitomeya imitator]|uniref:fibroblast growth factor 22 n=1 Tax=Ranitomeya imitator TaxID=111125 RepID=UPI0037E96056
MCGDLQESQHAPETPSMHSPGTSCRPKTLPQEVSAYMVSHPPSGRFYLQILGIFQVYSLNVGVVAILSAGTGLYIAMDRKGKVYGANKYGPNCKFHKRIEENGYNTYSSLIWCYNGHFMYLDLRGNVLKNWPAEPVSHYSTHFLG